MSESRREYMLGSGLVLMSDVSGRFFEDARTLEIHPVQDRDATMLVPGMKPSSAALNLVTYQLCDSLRSRTGANVGQASFLSSDFLSRYDITADDLDSRQNQFLNEHGFGDINFTFAFAPAIAGCLVDSFKRAGLLTDRQHARMGLGDWADIIRAPWFTTLIHDLAHTGNGLYGPLGEATDRGELAHALAQQLGLNEYHLFEVGTAVNQQTGKRYLTASINEDFKMALRQKMRTQDSPGCPVALRSGKLPPGLLRENNHAKRLIEDGRFILTPLSWSTQSTLYTTGHCHRQGPRYPRIPPRQI